MNTSTHIGRSMKRKNIVGLVKWILHKKIHDISIRTWNKIFNVVRQKLDAIKKMSDDFILHSGKLTTIDDSKRSNDNQIFTTHNASLFYATNFTIQLTTIQKKDELKSNAFRHQTIGSVICSTNDLKLF